MDEDQVAVKDAERRVETARASLRSHLDEIGRRYQATKDRLDVSARIVEHPHAAVGIAFGLGALLGLLGRSKRADDVAREGIGSTIVAALGALAFRALKEAALHEGGQIAKGWWADRSERDSSLDPSVEAFLEH